MTNFLLANIVNLFMVNYIVVLFLFVDYFMKKQFYCVVFWLISL